MSTPYVFLPGLSIVDGWDFKNYVLTTLFYRYISENLTNYINQGEREAGDESFDYAKMPDEDAAGAREGLIEEKGFFVFPSELFCNVVARAKDDPDLNETLEKIFRHIEESAMGTESEKDFKGLFSDFDVNSNKLGGTVAQRNSKLVKLLDGINSINFGVNQDTAIDAFGDTYFWIIRAAEGLGNSVGKEKVLETAKEHLIEEEYEKLITMLNTAK